ncbi:hypothetical protein [Limnohabitans radicicola]|uniref:hypothetical protein n=1 Tax=Limnohabitans radicicola TaxID=2771427 RepID=UPI001CD8C56B|nr:hypothetical protein [Limnohabitans radicicola]
MALAVGLEKIFLITFCNVSPQQSASPELCRSTRRQKNCGSARETLCQAAKNLDNATQMRILRGSGHGLSRG